MQDGSNQLGQQIENLIPPQRTMLTLPACLSLPAVLTKLAFQFSENHSHF